MAIALCGRCAHIQVQHLAADASITCSGPPHRSKFASQRWVPRSHRPAQPNRYSTLRHVGPPRDEDLCLRADVDEIGARNSSEPWPGLTASFSTRLPAASKLRRLPPLTVLLPD